MDTSGISGLLFILILALFGGLIARYTKLPPLLGYLSAGIVGSFILSHEVTAVQNLAEVGIVLLLFSVGLELSLSKLTHVGSIAIVGSIIQMIVTTIILMGLLMAFSVPLLHAFILSAGFSLSSTALVVKMLEERAEQEAIHGDIMIGWLITQDLAVIPLMAILPLLTISHGSSFTPAIQGFVVSFLVVLAVFFIGRKLVPYIISLLTRAKSREILLIGVVCIALGTAFLVTFFGVSAALGAFLAGLVISETQEKYEIFSETRPLRDIFAIIFFVTLGFFATPETIISQFFIIIPLALVVMVVKFFVIFTTVYLFGYRGRALLAVSIGLTQIGEFSFILFLTAKQTGILPDAIASVGIATALTTLIITPFLFRAINPLWRKVKGRKVFAAVTRPKIDHRIRPEELTNHIIICGFGRMGRWIGKALDAVDVPYVVIDYNQEAIDIARNRGAFAVFGDPSHPEVLEVAHLKSAKALVIAIPDTTVQEVVISYCQTVNPTLPIFARAHLDEDVTKLTQLKVHAVIQPEFEAGLSTVREILRLMGKQKTEIVGRLGSLRRSHTLSK